MRTVYFLTFLLHLLIQVVDVEGLVGGIFHGAVSSESEGHKLRGGWNFAATWFQRDSPNNEEDVPFILVT